MSAQGWKKEVFFYALKYGGKNLEELLEYSVKKVVKENRLLLNILKELNVLLNSVSKMS